MVIWDRIRYNRVRYNQVSLYLNIACVKKGRDRKKLFYWSFGGTLRLSFFTLQNSQTELSSKRKKEGSWMSNENDFLFKK